MNDFDNSIEHDNYIHVKCPICGGEKITWHYNDNFSSEYLCADYHCKVCSHRFIEPLFEKENNHNNLNIFAFIVFGIFAMGFYNFGWMAHKFTPEQYITISYWLMNVLSFLIPLSLYFYGKTWARLAKERGLSE